MGKFIDEQSIMALLDIAEGDQKFIDDIFNLFYDAGQTRIDKMEKHYANGDFKSCAAEAHAFKSSSYSVGASQISDICFRIERAQGQNLDPKIFFCLREFFQKSSDELKELRQQIRFTKAA